MTFPRALLAATCCTAMASLAGASGVSAASGNGAGGSSAQAPMSKYQLEQTGSAQSSAGDSGASRAIAHSASALARHPLRLGSHGPLVSTLQDLLSKAGLVTRVSGRFDRRTYRQLRSFQRAHRLPVNGHSDSATAAKLGAAAAAALNSGPTLPVAPATDNAGWVFPLMPVKAVQPPRLWTLDQGVDLAGARGQCAGKLVELAVASGTIVALGVQGFGSQAPVIKLDSGPDAGRFVYYGHAAPALVTVGEHVVAGQPVADVGCGNVGISSAPHLEIGISVPGSTTPCCPGRGETSGETLRKLKFAYRYAKTHPQLPFASQPAPAGSPPAAASGGGAAAAS